MIDPRADVHPSAVIGDGVRIGPFSVIEEDVKIGPGTVVGPHVVIRSRTSIGTENHIYQFCSIGEDPQFAGYAGQPTWLEIGDRNVIREYCTLNRGSPVGVGTTRIGDDNFLMAYVHVAHDCQLGDKTIFANCASLAGHVQVGDYAILGGFTLVHQYCRVGAHSITGIGTVCLKDVPPYVVAAGNTATPYGINVKGLRRRGFDDDVITALRRAYRQIYRSGLDQRTVIDQLESDGTVPAEVRALVEFVKSSKRGVIR